MPSSKNANSSIKTDEFDLIKLVGEIIDHKKLIISVTSFITLLAIFYGIFSTPVYQANALIQVEQKQANAILSNLSQMLPDSQPASAPEIALLQSRMVLGKTVDDLNLQAEITPDYFPIFGRGWARIAGEKVGNIELSRFYTDINSSKSDSDYEFILQVIDSSHYSLTGKGINIQGKVGELIDSDGVTIKVDRIDATENTKFNITYVTRLDAINNLQKVFTVADQGKDTGMLTLSIADEVPANAERILDSISNNYLAQNISRQAAQDEKSLEFLNQQLPQVRSELDTAEDKLNHYRQTKDSVDLTMEAKAVLDQIVNVDNQLNELTFRESEVSQLYTKEHPTYKALLEKRETLQDEKKKLNKRVSAMPETQQEVLRLSRDVESGRAVFIQLLNRQQELNIAKSSAIGYVRIIDQAAADIKPVKPKKIVVTIIGFIFGGIFSIGLVLIRVFIRQGIESPEQLEELGINVYASVPMSEALAKKRKNFKGKKRQENEYNSFLAIENPADLAIEAIRGLRTSLHFAMMEARNNILMISGASPDAGKTFISTNLAAIIGQGDKKVLFIDADMRKGYVHKLFNGELANGLSDFLSGKVGIQNIVQRVDHVGIDYVSRGMIPPNPAELLMHSRFEELTLWASENYDLVIIDTPPILAVTDAAIIGSYVGTSLIVARFEKNTAREIDVSFKRFEQNGITVKGCILNGMQKKASSYYGYGYNHYGYNYNHDKK